MTNNFFYIKTPYFGAWTKYGWEKNDWGIGLEKNRVDRLAREDSIVNVKYGSDITREYTIRAKEVIKYPVEQIKNYNKKVYIIPKSALRYKKPKTDEEKLKEMFEQGVFG